MLLPIHSYIRVPRTQDIAGGGWTTIQRRIDGSVDFHRDWEDYEEGFGDVYDGEHWLGNMHIHDLTTHQYTMELYILLEDANGQTAIAHYDEFVMGDDTNLYALEVLGTCTTCTEGDSLR